jgi:myo-inositol-1(or 4)-monophosphatase
VDDFKKVAVEAAREAAGVLLELAGTTIKYKMKSSRDIQAEADLRSEEIIIRKIKKAFPTHSIFAEETGEEVNESEYLWAIDPLDGTINYSRGIEEFCISIALSQRGQTILGVIYHPVRQQLLVAEKGKGTYLNGRKLEVSRETKIVNCLAATDNTSHLKDRRKNFSLLIKVADEVRQIRVFGSAALHLVKVAQGQLDFYFKLRYNHWDYAAAALIVQEAGGIVTDMNGQPVTRDSKSILAASGAVHPQALALLKRYTESIKLR